MTTPGRLPPAEEIAALLQSMSTWAQAELLGLARDMAKTWPAKRGGHLRLVPAAARDSTAKPPQK